MRVRILWVRPGDKSLSPGDLLETAELEARGYSVVGLIAAGEAEAVASPAAAPADPEPPKRRGRKPAAERA